MPIAITACSSIHTAKVCEFKPQLVSRSQHAPQHSCRSGLDDWLIELNTVNANSINANAQILMIESAKYYNNHNDLNRQEQSQEYIEAPTKGEKDRQQSNNACIARLLWGLSRSEIVVRMVVRHQVSTKRTR
eukprot:m.45079 g.45079  ORF g.45079 m.45079 type:complete len:132 (+) comp10863_c0_seq1:3629-4024(+)